MKSIISILFFINLANSQKIFHISNEISLIHVNFQKYEAKIANKANQIIEKITTFISSFSQFPNLLQLLKQTSLFLSEIAKLNDTNFQLIQTPFSSICNDINNNITQIQFYIGLYLNRQSQASYNSSSLAVKKINLAIYSALLILALNYAQERVLQSIVDGLDDIVCEYGKFILYTMTSIAREKYLLGVLKSLSCLDTSTTSLTSTTTTQGFSINIRTGITRSKSLNDGFKFV
ncbi:hypothetical protein PVAND_012811 [Polypedilum vanderplanki]|uniref:Transmembrane protein n=1 Tax=Polypedilum vanderplanki TaxID=319348 RepID=A0A9J6CMS2_POLVA|nr:hypothetical protein PVAND_012811 [Polypedilum vanderplanki]